MVASAHRKRTSFEGRDEPARQWISSDSSKARRRSAIEKPGFCAAAMITASRRAIVAAAASSRSDLVLGHHHRAVAVGMDEVAGTDPHAGNVDRPVEGDEVGPDMRGHDRAGKHEEAVRPLGDVAHGAVGDDAAAAEALVDVALHLAPEGAEAGFDAVDVLDHDHARLRPGGDVFVVGKPEGAQVGGACRLFLARADRRGAGIADDRLLRHRRDQRRAVEAEATPLRGDDLERVADGRGIERGKGGEIGRGRHGRFRSLLVEMGRCGTRAGPAEVSGRRRVYACRTKVSLPSLANSSPGTARTRSVIVR